MTKEEFKVIQAELRWSNSQTARELCITLPAIEHYRSGRRGKKGIPGPVAELLRIKLQQHRRRQAQQKAADN